MNFTLGYLKTVKSKVEILQNFVAFSEYMNFTEIWSIYRHKKVIPRLTNLYLWKKSYVILSFSKQ